MGDFSKYDELDDRGKTFKDAIKGLVKLLVIMQVISIIIGSIIGCSRCVGLGYPLFEDVTTVNAECISIKNTELEEDDDILSQHDFKYDVEFKVDDNEIINSHTGILYEVGKVYEVNVFTRENKRCISDKNSPYSEIFKHIFNTSAILVLPLFLIFILFIFIMNTYKSDRGLEILTLILDKITEDKDVKNAIDTVTKDENIDDR